MKKFLFLSLLLVLTLTSCWESVDRLHYGVKYNSCSSTLNMEDLSVVYGRYNTCAACCDISDFPTTPMVKSFQLKESETSEENSQFIIPIGTASVEFDYNLEFQIKSEDDAKKVFMSCRAGKDFDSYVRNNMKNNLRDIFKNVMRNFRSPEALIDSTSKFELLCFQEIQKRFIEDGVTVTRANLINNFRWPANVQTTLDDIISIKATTMKAESQAKASELESKAKIIKVEADSKANIMEAEAKAKISLIEAETEAKRITKINSALTDKYLRLQEIENFTYKTELVTPQGVYKISQKEN
jgi:regulator of protease activity HflC (stomatin/prohibitin superfamily)